MPAYSEHVAMQPAHPYELLCHKVQANFIAEQVPLDLEQKSSVCLQASSSEPPLLLKLPAKIRPGKQGICHR